MKYLWIMTVHNFIGIVILKLIASAKQNVPCVTIPFCEPKASQEEFGFWYITVSVIIALILLLTNFCIPKYKKLFYPSWLIFIVSIAMFYVIYKSFLPMGGFNFEKLDY